MNIHGSGNVLEAFGYILSQLIIDSFVGSDKLDVDWGGYPKIQDLADHVRGLEKELRSGEFPGEMFAQMVDVVSRWPLASGLQTDEDFGVGFADDPGVAVDHVDRAVKQSNVVQNVAEVPRRN